MSKITQLIPSVYTHTAYLDKKIRIQSSDRSITKIEFLNRFTQTKLLLPVLEQNGEIYCEIPKYFEPGYYLVVCIFSDGAVGNSVDFTCYPSLTKPAIDSIPLSGGNVKINGFGFTDKTIITAYYGNDEEETIYEYINTNELICCLKAYDGKDRSVVLKCTVNGIDSMSMLYLRYSEPVIRDISTSSISFQVETDVCIRGENFGESAENVEIFISDFVGSKKHIVNCSNNEINCKVLCSDKIGPAALFVQICGIKSNEKGVCVLPSVTALSENIISVESLRNSEIILQGYGFKQSTKLLFNGIPQPYTEVLSDRELIVDTSEIREPQEIWLSVETNGYVSEQKELLKIIDHDITGLSSTTGHVNESSTITINGFGFQDNVQIIIEKEGSIVETIDVLPTNENTIDFTFPATNQVGYFSIYVVKNNLPSRKYKYLILPKTATCYPETFPIAIGDAEIVTGYIKIEGDVTADDIRLELECDERDYFVSPKLTKTMEKDCSIFAFKMKEFMQSYKIIVNLVICDVSMKTNHICFIPKITKIHPNVINLNEESEIEIHGHGFTEEMEIYINNAKIQIDISESLIKTEPFQPGIGGPLQLLMKINENVYLKEWIYVKPIVENIEFPVEIANMDKPFFYVNCKGLHEDMIITATINNNSCSCTINDSQQIMVTIQKYENDIKNADLVLSFEHDNQVIPWYRNAKFTYPQMIYAEKYDGLCTKNNKVIIKGLGIDKNTKIKMNGELLASTFSVNSLTFIINSTNTCGKYEIMTIDEKGASSVNKITYSTIPELTELSQTTGGAKGGNNIIIYGIGISENIHAVWFNKTKITENIKIEDDHIVCKVPPMQTSIIDKTNVFIETNDRFMSNALLYQYTPQIDGQSAINGYIAGGYNLSLYGQGFKDCDKVEFGDMIIRDFSEHTNTLITFQVPRAKNGNETISIKTTNTRQIASNEVQFDYLLPKLTHIEPQGGYIRGGEKLIIFGEGFSNDVVLYIGKKLMDSATIYENNIRCVAPESSSAFDINISIKFENKIAEKMLQYTYHAQKISSISPSTGLMSGGYEMTVTGEGFLSENVYLTVGNKIIRKADFLKHTDELIEFLMPPNQSAGEAMIDVIVNNVKSENNIPFYYASKINSISVTSSYVNTKVPITIEGEGFTGMSIVKMGSTIINNVSFDPKTGSITFLTPLIQTAQTMPITVATNNSVTNAIMFTVKPIIKAINPNPWIAEDIGFLYILGEGFSSASIGCIMGVDKTEPKIIEPIKISNNTLIFAMPYVKQSGDINIAIGTAIGSEDSWIARKVTIFPKITKLSENYGSIIGGNYIEIIGKGFNKYSKIAIDGEPVDDTIVEYTNENSIALKVPSSNQLKEIKISIMNNNMHSNTVSYSYCPFIQDIKPNFSTINGGSTSIISGEGFNDKSIVLFNNKPIAKANTVYDEKKRELAIIIPQHFEVENTVVKVITNGIESYNNVKFYYTPVMDSISINHSSVNKQEIMTVTGDGFCTNTMVKIGEKFIDPQTILKITSNYIQFRLPNIDEQSLKDIRVFTNSIPTAMTKTIAFSAELTNIVPHVGQVSGGTAVNIYGHGFNNDMIVFFNETKTDYTLISRTQMSIITPKDAGHVGTNKIILQCSKYTTNLSANFICYPSLSYITQKYNPVTKKMSIVLYGSGFTANSTVDIGNTTGLIPVFLNNSLKIEIDETYDTEIIKPIPVHVIVNGLKTHDEIYYSNIPCITSSNTNQGSVNGGDTISLYGAGFEKDSVHLLIEEFNLQIKPFHVTSSVIKFRTPKVDYAEKIHIIVVSNNYKSTPFEFIYCPCIYSASESICNVGEEIKFKIYGEGFENFNTDIFVKNHGKCKLTHFFNNKIIEVKLPSIKKCGIVEISTSVRNINSCNTLNFEIRPVILSFEQDYVNANGGFIEINGIGLHSVKTVAFVYKENVYEFTNIVIAETTSKTSYEKIKVFYQSLEYCKKIMKDENLEFINFEVIVKGTGVESIPHKCIMKNIEFNANAEIEAIKAINICNNYLSNNYASYTYNFIKAYSDELTITITELITKICELPGTYLNPEAEKILIAGFTKQCKNSDISQVIINYTIMRMVRTMIDMLSSGVIYETVLTVINSPLTVFSPVAVQEYVSENIDEIDYDYLFYDCVEYKNDKLFNILDAQELSKAISFKTLFNDTIEFNFNEEILNNICESFNKLFMQKKFMLCNNSGHFQGSSVICPEGNIPDLFVYKITSSIVGYPQQETPLLDVHAIKQNIINYENTSKEKSLGNQLKQILTKPSTLKTIHEQFVKKNPGRFVKKEYATNFAPMPFQRGDKIRIKLFISGKIKYVNMQSKSNIKTNELFYKSCDPDIYDKSRAIDFLLNHDASEIRATQDCYEITLG